MPKCAFGRSAAPDPTGRFYSAPPYPWLDLWDPLLRGGEGREGDRRIEEAREGKGRGRDGKRGRGNGEGKGNGHTSACYSPL